VCHRGIAIGRVINPSVAYSSEPYYSERYSQQIFQHWRVPQAVFELMVWRELNLKAGQPVEYFITKP